MRGTAMKLVPVYDRVYDRVTHGLLVIVAGSSKAGFLALDVALVFLQDAPMSLFLPSGETSL